MSNTLQSFLITITTKTKTLRASRRRIVSLVDLQSSFDRLYESKEDGKSQNQHCYPECVPLHPIASVMPPLTKSARSRLIKSLLENHQPVSPEFEMFDLAMASVKVPAPGESPVHEAITALLIFLAKILQPRCLRSLGTSCSGEFRLRE